MQNRKCIKTFSTSFVEKKRQIENTLSIPNKKTCVFFSSSILDNDQSLFINVKTFHKKFFWHRSTIKQGVKDGRISPFSMLLLHQYHIFHELSHEKPNTTFSKKSHLPSFHNIVINVIQELNENKKRFRQKND